MLYLDIKNIAVDYGYKPEIGMYSQNICGIAETVAAKYGYNIAMQCADNFEGARNSILNGYAAVIGVNDSSTYSDHAMALIGYLKYTYKFLLKTYSKYFFAVDDGWGTSKNNYIHISDDEISDVKYRTAWFDPNKGAECEYIYII